MLNPMDNALFLQNWRERMRPSTVIAAIIITILTLVLIFLGTYLDDRTYRRNDPNLEAFWLIAIGQGILLLLVGTSSAHNMAVRERNSGTLDFHRASPSTRFEQILGMLLGAPSLEWCVFLMTMPAAGTLAVLGGIPWERLAEFYGALVLCALFFHLSVIFLALAQDRKQSAVNRRGTNAIKLFVFFYFFGSFLVLTQNFSSLYHLTCWPQYAQVAELIYKDQDRYSYRNDPDYAPYYEQQKKKKELLNMFYGIKVPSWFLQMLVQIPLICLFWVGTNRKISYPERFAFSKSHTLTAITFLIFLYLGSAISILLESVSYKSELDAIALGTLWLVLFLGILGAIGNTPTQLMYLKGLRRTKKLKLKGIDWSDDQSSNLMTLIVFAMILLVAFKAVSPWIDYPTHQRMLLLTLTLLYVFNFAFSLEYFRLSPHHKKRTLFLVGVGIVWGFLPMLGWTLRSVLEPLPNAMTFFLAPSPFSGFLSMFESFQPWQTKPDPVSRQNIIVFINGAFALAMFLLSCRERRRLQQEVFGETK